MAITYDADGKITKTSYLLVLFSHGRKGDPKFSHVVAHPCKIRVQLHH